MLTTQWDIFAQITVGWAITFLRTLVILVYGSRGHTETLRFYQCMLADKKTTNKDCGNHDFEHCDSVQLTDPQKQ